MLLTIDIGNTTIQAGVFNRSVLEQTWRLSTEHDRLADEYGVLLCSLFQAENMEISQIDGAVISSVVPALLPIFEEVCRRFLDIEPLVVTTSLQTGLKISYEHPSEIGADRIVDAVAAIKRHGPPPLIVVDFGTATVFDAIDKGNVYLGGAIAPGIGIASEALFSRASQLASVDLERPSTAIGRTTKAAVQAGILFGYVGLVEGIIARFKAELGGGRVGGPGGWVERVARETATIDAVDSELALYGLQIIYELNSESM